MKTSEIDKAIGLRNNLRHLRTLQEKTERLPRFDGYLVIDGERLNMTPSEVDAVVSRRRTEITAAASDLGLEIDE